MRGEKTELEVRGVPWPMLRGRLSARAVVKAPLGLLSAQRGLLGMDRKGGGALPSRGPLCCSSFCALFGER